MSGPGRPKFGVTVLTMGNRPDDLNRGLASLLNQRDVDLDIVVVGNGWQPVGLPEGVKAHGLPENLGIPAGRNAGVNLVKETCCSSSTMMPGSRSTTRWLGWRSSLPLIRHSA